MSVIKTLWKLGAEIEKIQPKREVHSSLDFAPQEVTIERSGNFEPRSSITKQDLESHSNFQAEGGEKSSNVIDLNEVY